MKKRTDPCKNQLFYIDFNIFYFNGMKKLRIIGSNQEIETGKILCLGRNYAEHAKEMKFDVPSLPIVFMKPSTAIICNGEAIVRPKISKELHHEVELVVAIGKTGKNIPASEAYDYICGYAVGLDMTLRDIQSEAKTGGLPWTVAKGFDTSAAVSDIISKSRIANPHDLTLRCKVNGSVRQQSSTGKMILTIDRIIEYISSLFTLESGDLIFTGTPEGVGEVKHGDTIEAELVGYATISHPVIAE